MKKLISIILFAAMLLLLSVNSFSAEETSLPKKVTIYTLDSRSAEVNENEVEAYLSQGWYLSPVTIVYSLDQRTCIIDKSQLDAYLRVGWYSAPVVQIYSINGDSSVVYQSDLEAYKAVGWYDNLSDVQIAMYDKQGNEIQVFKGLTAWFQSQGYLLIRPGYIDPSKPMVAMTFDDGPSNHTTSILDCLSAYGAKATFFVVGQRCNTYASVLNREYNLGMEIGNHTYSHANLPKMSPSDIRIQLDAGSNAIWNVTKTFPSLIRPPYGATNESVQGCCTAPVILWSIDTLDWKTRNADNTYNTVLSQVKDGDIILMHDVYDASAKAAVRLIPKLIERGFQLVTVSELGQYKYGGLQNGTVYRQCR